VDQKLIFDLGLHNGRDTDFYLAKGFKVIALEANPTLTEACFARLSHHVASGHLIIENKALWDLDQSVVSFYVNDSKDDWSSLFKDVSEKGVSTAREIRIKTITLQRMVALYGVPYYAKCDMENADAIFARQMVSLKIKPAYVSVEVNDCTLPALLYAAGYDRFQLINQYQHLWTEVPNPAREGQFIDFKFDHHCTGLFGRELDPQGWQDLDATAGQIVDAFRMKRDNPKLMLGWFDVHATTQDELDRDPTRSTSEMPVDGIALA